MSYNTASGLNTIESSATPLPLAPPSKLSLVPNGSTTVVIMTPHDQRRRAALLADSPELSSRPPLNAGGGSGSILGVLQEAHTQMSGTGSSSSTTSSNPHGFDHHDQIEVESSEMGSSPVRLTQEQPKEPQTREPTSGCCTFCKSTKCRNWRWRLKATFGGLTER